MDIRTGKTYGSLDDARADGVPESDIAFVDFVDGEPKPSFARPKKIQFTKGSFKPVKAND